jgi:glycine/D-amino acid oxidase-like deaminating enzyme
MTVFPALKVKHHSDELEGVSPDWSGDLLVVGGGSAGCAAAVAAARQGSRVLLLEAMGFPGGTGAAVLDTFYGFFAPGSGQRVVGGIGWELCEGLIASEQAFLRENTYGAGTGVTYEPDFLKLAWDQLLSDAGVSLLFYTTARSVVMNNSTIVGIIADSRSGPMYLEATTIIDATGDADVAWRAGAALEIPVEAKKLQPMTMTFRVGGVDISRVTTGNLHDQMRAAGDSGEYDLPRREGSVHRTVLDGVVHTNLTRVQGRDGTNPWDLSAAEVEGRRQVMEYMRFLRDRAEGFEDSFLLQISPRIGVRETRRLVGEYVLTREDVLSARQFGDQIALCGAPVEDHSAGDHTKWEYIGGDQPNGETYGIPFSTLVPREVEGMLVAGRCLSATHDAHASVRSIGQCIAMGEAAGTAAALATAENVPAGRVSTDTLRDHLAGNGVLL